MIQVGLTHFEFFFFHRPHILILHKITNSSISQNDALIRNMRNDTEKTNKQSSPQPTRCLAVAPYRVPSMTEIEWVDVDDDEENASHTSLSVSAKIPVREQRVVRIIIWLLWTESCIDETGHSKAPDGNTGPPTTFISQKNQHSSTLCCWLLAWIDRSMYGWMDEQIHK